MGAMRCIRVYCGYWSFEARAVVKILNIDDTGMEQMPYSLYNLVYYK